MSVREYVGARYVPLFDEDTYWDSTKEYEPLTIVLHEGNSYTSRQYVPVGIDITNDEFWAETGNYNAQIEGYRKETLNLQTTVDSNTTNIANNTTNIAANTVDIETNKTNIAANTANIEALTESTGLSISELTNDVRDAMLCDTAYFEVLHRDANDTSYFYTNPPAPQWDTVQGCCWTKNGRFAGVFTTGLEYYNVTNTQYLNRVVIKEFNGDGSLYRTSSPILAYHGNSICYNPINDELLVAANYYLNGDGSTTHNESNVVTKIDYETLTRTGSFNAPSIGTVCNGISYCEADNSLAVFNTDTFIGAYINPSTYAFVSNIDLSALRYIWSKTTNEMGATHRQSANHNEHYIFCNTYQPNMFLVLDRNDPTNIVKYIHCDDGYSYEAEDFDVQDDGTLLFAKFRRFANASAGVKQVVSNIWSLNKGNIYKSSFTQYFANTHGNDGLRYIRIDPSTTNYKQTGSENCPCKTAMEAYYLWLTGGKTAALYVPVSASGKIIFFRAIGAGSLFIYDRSNGAVKWNENFRLRNGKYILQGLTFNRLTGANETPYGLSDTAGNMSCEFCDLILYGCAGSTSNTFGISNSVYIKATNTTLPTATYNQTITP